MENPNPVNVVLRVNNPPTSKPKKKLMQMNHSE
jgi:hypothetical protein